MADLNFAVLGTGWWSTFQIAAWSEVGGVRLVAVYNRTRSRAEKVAARFNVPRVYDDPEELFRNEKLDFVDIITDVVAHAPMVYLAAKYKVPVICQKPMAPDFETCQKMVQTCREAGVPFMIHENLRWQTPVRALKRLLNEGRLGKPFRARLQLIGCLPSEYIDQPLLKTLEHLILTDMGSHLLDTARFLFGEADSLYCQHCRTRDDIAGEDVATVMMRMGDVTCTCELSNASWVEWRYPQLLGLVEGQKGSIEVLPDYQIRVTTQEGTFSRRYDPPDYAWALREQLAWHPSIVDCNANLLEALKTGNPPETSADDNLETMRLVYAAYESAARNQVITLADERVR